MKKKLFILFVCSIFSLSYGQGNIYPPIAGPDNNVELYEYSSIEMYARGYHLVEDWIQGITFRKFVGGYSTWAGVGLHGTSSGVKERLYFTHGQNPWSSTLGINILPSGFTGIGTLTPTTTLEITALPEASVNAQDGTKDAVLVYGNSGLRLTNLKSTNDPTPNAAPIGVDATGKVVRVEGGGSTSASWLLTGNIATNPSLNFLGTTDSQPLVIKTNDAERLRIAPTGNVGIGTTNPTTSLEITSPMFLRDTDPEYGNSGLRLTNLTSNNNPIVGAAPIGVDATGKVVRVEGGGSSRDAWLLSGNEETNPLVNFLGTTDNQPLVIRTNNAQTLRINTSGRLVFYNSDLAINAANSNLYIAGGNDSPIPGHTGIASNTVVGISSFRANTSGQFNTVFGNSLLYKNTTGSTNTVIGYNSMINSTTGSQNVVVGSNSMNAATTSTQNVIVGNNALNAVTTTGNYNVAVGNGSLSKTTTGRYNIHLGYYDATTGITTGTRNIGIGFNAGKNLTTGSNNIIIGSESTEGLPSIIINAPIGSTESNQLNIGNWIYGYNGQIAIGSFTPLSGNIKHIFTNNPEYQLIVKNGIKTEKVRVELSSANGWPDYVFDKDYDLMSLEDLTSFVTLNKHLPNIPKAEELVTDGINLGEMDAKLLEKIEELTLYNIDLYKESKILKEENNLLKEQTENLLKENVQQQQLLEDLIKRVEQLESNK